jgi:DnaJ-class molecular chaperone
VVNRNNLENPFLKTSEDDLVYTANVSLTDIYLNAQKVLNVPRKRVCDHCLGVGYLGYGSDMSLCQICKGLMITSDSKIFSIDIKKTKLLFEKEGNQRLEHLPGDLIIYVQPKPHPTFRIINQYDLLYIHQISLINLYQYLEIQLEHLDGRIYNIIYDPKDNNVLKDKCLLKIKEKGLLMGDSNRRGDLYIQLKVQYPDLTREQFIAVKQILLNNVDVDVDDLNNFNNFNKNEIKNNDKVNIELMAELPDQSYQVDT